MGGFIGSDQPYKDGTHEKELKLVAKYPYHNEPGNCLHFHDGAGHIIVWFSKRRVEIEVGQKIRASFVVKSHTVYEGSQQNIAKLFRIVDRL